MDSAIISSKGKPPTHKNIRSAQAISAAPIDKGSSAQGGPGATFRQTREISSMITGQMNAILTGVGRNVDTFA